MMEVSHVQGEIVFPTQAGQEMHEAERVWSAGDTDDQTVTRVNQSML